MSGPTPRRLTLGRSQRLKGSRAFAALKAEGERRVAGCLIVNWRKAPEEGPTRIGVVTSRRIGNSVARSRARRLIREAYRLNQHSLAGPLHMVLVARASVTRTPLKGVCEDLRRAFRGTGLWNPPSPTA